jgi:hypothetical protein
MRSRSDVYLDSLKDGLLAIRYAAHKGDAAWCFAEADHLHNIPGLVKHADDANHRYYLDCTRRGYLAAMGTKYDHSYDLLWEELGKAAT